MHTISELYVVVFTEEIQFGNGICLSLTGILYIQSNI